MNRTRDGRARTSRVSRWRPVWVVWVLAVWMAAVSCSTAGDPSANPSTVPGATDTTAMTGGTGAGSTTAPGSGRNGGGGNTVWLCRPGLSNNPCQSDLTATVIDTDGNRSIEAARPASDAPIDCFYVYPTVSGQPTPNANLDIDPELRAVAAQQVSRFSEVCRVFAPVYPQLTVASITAPSANQAEAGRKAYEGVASAWKDYLEHDNDGRGVVLIGHSQGTGMLTQLVRREIDANADVRRRLVSALLIGGWVTVPKGRDVGGDFQQVPACRSENQTGCVVAYNSFGEDVPAAAAFGRAGPSPFGSGSTTAPGPLEVLCVNPAAPAGGAAPLRSYQRTDAFPGLLGVLIAGMRSGPAPIADTAWISSVDAYRGACVDESGANVLRVSPNDGAPVLKPQPTAAWGLHLADINLALGDLIDLVRRQSDAYRSRS